jgi:hypothetical protein
VIHDVELDTAEEWKAKLGELDNIKNYSAINMILTRKFFPGCFQFSNDFIAQRTGHLSETIAQIDALNLRPLQQFFETEDMCNQCIKCNVVWRMHYPWTGSTLVHSSFLPETSGCKTVQLTPGGISILTSAGSSWMIPCDSQINVIVYRKTVTQYRLYVDGYPSINRYHEFNSTNDYMRFMLMLRYISHGNRDSQFNIGLLAQTDPHYLLIQEENWKITPSLLWSNRIAEMEARINSKISSRSDSVKIITERFKEQISICGSFADFMDQYYPKTDVISLAALCRAWEQPA